MQAAIRKDGAYRLFGTDVRVELPAPLIASARAVLDLFTGPHAFSSPAEGETSGEAGEDVNVTVRVSPSPGGWIVESGGRRERAASDEEAVLRLQEQLLEAAAAHSGDRLLFRGSVVARGSQSLLIVGDLGPTHAVLAVALTALDFRFVSVGAAAFDARTLTPHPLPLAFRLEPVEQRAFEAVRLHLDERLERVSTALYRPRGVTPAPEPTHALFPEAHGGSLSLVRPISATAARARLCSALIAAPEGESPFASVAALVRHTRGIHLSLGDLPQALEQLGRLLPRWSVGLTDGSEVVA